MLNAYHWVKPQSRHRCGVRRCSTFHHEQSVMYSKLVLYSSRSAMENPTPSFSGSAQWDKGQSVFSPLCFWFTPPLGKCCINFDLNSDPLNPLPPPHGVPSCKGQRKLTLRSFAIKYQDIHIYVYIYIYRHTNIYIYTYIHIHSCWILLFAFAERTGFLQVQVGFWSVTSALLESWTHSLGWHIKIGHCQKDKLFIMLP